jgi:hypothetical protein
MFIAREETVAFHSFRSEILSGVASASFQTARHGTPKGVRKPRFV